MPLHKKTARGEVPPDEPIERSIKQDPDWCNILTRPTRYPLLHAYE